VVALHSSFPPAQGLYDPTQEKDACGIGLVAQIRGIPSHSLILDALTILKNLEHRGAEGADSKTGDGTGLLVQIPHRFLKAATQKLKINLGEAGSYGVGMVFLPPDEKQRKEIEQWIERITSEESARFLGWRTVPVQSSVSGPSARATEPVIRQFFVESTQGARGLELERLLYVIRRRIEKVARSNSYFAIPSFSSSTLVYKGLLLPDQLQNYYTDLSDPAFESAIAMVHARFSTNTFPSWILAHPYRYLCHNGEINTLKGNLNWMKAREGNLVSQVWGEKMTDLLPVVAEGQSDSACLDNLLEFLILSGRSLPHAMMMLIPEPWSGNPSMDIDRRGFYEYHAAIMEPWDGPAAVLFTDGKSVGATLDRNGLRPGRYLITTDDRVILSSEAGVLPMKPSLIRKKGRLEPGKMFFIDTLQGRVIEDEELKAEISHQRPYRSWVAQHQIALDELPDPTNVAQPTHRRLTQRQRVFGYTEEDLKFILAPMAIQGEEPTSSMGKDTPLAVLSQRPQLLFHYFRQLFAQVTNPPIDPIREHLIMSLATSIGPKANLLGEAPEACRRIRIKQPILTNVDLQKIREIPGPNFKSKTLSLLCPVAEGAQAFDSHIQRLCSEASAAVREGYKILILSDRLTSRDLAPIPSLLAVAAVHKHLIDECTRPEVGLIVETGEAREVHHFACLLGYGAGSVNPYLAFESLTDLANNGHLPEGLDAVTAHQKYIKGVGKGLLKIFSKMGISTLQSYYGAQIFEAIGLGSELIEKYFSGTASRIGGLTIEQLGTETLKRHALAYTPEKLTTLEIGGDIHYRIQGESHQWNPETILALQHSTRTGNAKTFAEFSALADPDPNQIGPTLRSLLEFEFAAKPVLLEEVEPAKEILKRFTSGAMSLGAISREAHETLAIAMNQIGGKSNTGEGGEDPVRFNSPSNSAIKQIASARFGVTTEYLLSAQEIQIKMAQGAKPGEGGQLPGHKVDDYIAKLRHSTPGVQLISPPPHHDIYSIEDLKQLIFDLKNVNPLASVSVKLVSEVGVGTVAAGVAKAGADKILISGDSGGTGASPLSSIQHAGLPWELGLAETQQTLMLNGLRSRVRVETDGQLKTGRDVAIAALLGAEEFGFATAPLIVEGCIMMRKCHLNTCPVGVATQDPILRKKFSGKSEHLVNYFFFVAEELRVLMSRLGFRTVEEMVGRTDRLKVRSLESHWKAKHLDLSPLLYKPKASSNSKNTKKSSELDQILDQKLWSACQAALERKESFKAEFEVTNTDRSVGAFLSGQVLKKFGGAARAPVEMRFKGSAGQSFGAFLVKGISLELEGEGNDYVGKGLSGGRVSVLPPENAAFSAESSILVGNTCLYGATSGELYIAGLAGERFAVRNSGATTVVEGVGDHGCEYMTGGRVVVLGPTGRNFAAGMSGGIAYVLDEDTRLSSRCNLGMVELEELEDEDQKELLELVREHARSTKSRKAQALLDSWPKSVARFKKVMPTDYKRILAARGESAHV